MKQRALSTALGLALAAAPLSADEKLVSIIPTLYGPGGLVVDSEARLPSGETHSAHFNSHFQSEFTQFNIALASQLTSVPIPSPASGFTYEFDPGLGELGVYKRSTRSFGPILAERAETVGRGRWSLGLSVQHFSFDTIEGVDLGAIPAVFSHDGASPGGRADVVTTVNAIEASVDQYTGFVTYGLAEGLDVSLAIPVVRTRLRAASEATIQRIGTTDPRVHFFADGSGGFGSVRRFASEGEASGLGDLLVRGKRTLTRGGSRALALMLDVRLPTGDAEDFLGAGALGLRPFVAASFSHGRLSPHLNVGYQWNGRSVLAGDAASGTKEPLPAQLLYVAGVDFGLSDRVTVALDLVGRTVFDTPRLTQRTFTAVEGPFTSPDIRLERRSLSSLDGSVGLKANALGKVLVHVNVSFKLNEAGVRDSVTPLIGCEYGF